MSKLDELRRSMGANVTESASKRDAVAAPTLAALSSARTEGVARSKNALEIQVDRIIPDPSQPREEFDADALDRLAASLKSRGQIQPIRVRWDEGQGIYVIVSGERRWRAARMAGLATLSCVVNDSPLEGGDLLALQLIENCVREDLAPIEQAKAFRALMVQTGWSGNRLAQELGIAQSSVVHALALLELPTEVQSQVEQGELPASTAYEISKAGDADTIRAVAAEVAAAGLSRAETVERVREMTRKRSGGKTKAKGRGVAKKPVLLKSRIVRLAGGKVTVDLRKAGEAAAILALLEEAAAVLRREVSEEQGRAAEAA